MYGQNCVAKGCQHKTGRLGTYNRCSSPNKRMFILREKPSKKSLEKAIEYANTIKEQQNGKV